VLIITLGVFLLALLTLIKLSLMVTSRVLLFLDLVLVIAVLIGAFHHACSESWLGYVLLMLCLRMLNRCFLDGVYELLLRKARNLLQSQPLQTLHMDTAAPSTVQLTGTISACSRLTVVQAEANGVLLPSTNLSMCSLASEALDLGNINGAWDK